MPTVSVKLTDEELNRLDRLCAARSLTKSDIIRELIRQAPEEEGAAEPGSFFEAARDLCGILNDEESPLDLSSNKKWFDSFGHD
ncbi:MAG: CopG family transcriptional regulator [Verrucomicrobiota bacterium JB022]|nr:CopG family transcriptional regulator [Verrucomicrobiota bacterium JB022]